MKKLAAIAILAALPLLGSATGIPVVDVASIAQEIKQGLTQIQQYSQAVQSYQLQLQQYENQVRNTVAPVAQIWQQAQGTMNNVMGVTRVFQNGNLESTLSQFQDVNYWLSASPTSYALQTANSMTQKQTNDAMIKGIVAQQEQIQQDAANLQRLQSQAGSADGQMKAMMAANQLAALEQQQLLQIRELLVTEQQALAARNGSVSSREAMQDAYSKDAVTSPYTFTDHQGWAP
jgi:type IV secretion system protein TrbJ